MKKSIGFLLASLALLFMMVVTPVLGTSVDQIDDEAIAEIEQLLIEMSERSNNMLSGAVLIAQGDEILLAEGYNEAVIEWNVPNTTDTVFRIGSLTKQFTGIAILRLQEDGLLDVDDLICDHLNRCPDAWSDITIWHLLTHTSGIVDYTSLTREMSERCMIAADQGEVVDMIIDLDLRFEPGTRWEYSNSGYHLLGEIIEEASGSPYFIFLRNTFFNPLGMEDTRLGLNVSVIERQATGYTNTSMRSEYINMNIPYSAGGLVSTAEDLLKWQRALYTGQVVSQESLDEMWSRAFELDEMTLLRSGVDFPVSYAYGMNHALQPSANGTVNVYRSSGGINGFTSFMSYAPELDVTIIVLANHENGAFFEAHDRVQEIILGEPAED